MAKAQKGDLIRIINAMDGERYKNGEIYEVSKAEGSVGHVRVKCSDTTDDYAGWLVLRGEYKIHREAGEEDAPKTEVIAGVGPDAPVVENEYGAKQSQSPYRMDLIDAKALLKIAEVHKQGGDKYGDTNWHNIPVNDHINHALVHIYAHLAEDTSDEHLAHAATRMIFALALQLRKTIIE